MSVESVVLARGDQGLRGLWFRLGVWRFPVAVVALLSVAGVVVAAAMLTQTISTSPSAETPDVLFATGPDYAAINAAGFATLTVGTSGTSASLDLGGIPGAASLSLGDLLQVQNQDLSQAYDVTLVRGAVPNGAITSMLFTVQTAADATVATFDPTSAVSSSTFSLPANTDYDISVDLVIADATAIGSLGSFDLQFQLVPV